MNFEEYAAKPLLAGKGIAVPRGGLAKTPDEAAEVAARIGGAVVVKAQVPAGKRGKAGGVKLAATPDGDGSLLDHSMIVYGSALSDGNLHLYTDLPLLVVAGGVKGIKGGRHVRYRGGVPMTNLLLTMLDKAGVPHVEKLGDSTGRLEI